jgi:DNA-binding transcriptional ArsR family regulator
MDAFEAISDPTRRQILGLLRDGERTAGDVAAQFSVSRPAVSRHLRVLRESGFIAARGEAQRRLYRLRPDALVEVAAWLDGYRAFWEARLDALERHLDAAEDERTHEATSEGESP